jgi:hypothetical protein
MTMSIEATNQWLQLLRSLDHNRRHSRLPGVAKIIRAGQHVSYRA